MIKSIAPTVTPFRRGSASETKIVPFKPPQSPPQTLAASLVTVFRPVETKELVPIPKLPPRQTFEAQRTTGWVSRQLNGYNLVDGRRIDVELPFHTPRTVNGATLKALLGGKPFELLLKRNGSSWDICENDTRIDLLDNTNQFRVGPVAVYS